MYVDQSTSEVALALFDLHGAVLIVVDDAIGALGIADRNQFLDDFGDGVGVRANCACAGTAAKRTQAAIDPLLFAGKALMNGCSTGMSESPRTSMRRCLAK